ncbi:glycosyltransferase family 9 protein [Chromohalobacter canadensis]|uniref:Glycosyltransferase family 9 protein n=1 Tax=Chromohalobacter canadensis TaxID=141389 RepID=A0ABZ0Y663_9GAMM|nr:glycosyltransferase family 9 protein [Chromohalobacter canadensis]MCK0769229.1 glycosyltransferase family 9 protein [Chromohalobacter canadensis]WQH07561.1 glycosyltransferase family 9 protein [Chromohalobacter canadensis]
MTQSRPQRILVVRNDKLGDFMLAWPALACLKSAHPDNHVAVLVPTYTAPLAHACPWIDEVILDPGGAAPQRQQKDLLAQLRAAKFDALLTLFSTPRIGWLGWRAGISLRMAPATKWAQVFYNFRIKQRRSQSQKPEYVYNQDLASSLLHTLGQDMPTLAPPYWPLPDATRDTQRQRLSDELSLPSTRPWWFLHPGSGGSAVNLSVAQYVDLAQAISAKLSTQPKWVVTYGPSEEPIAQHLVETLNAREVDAVLMPPRASLTDFAETLAVADVFVAGSTGPLHIAGALNRPTIGFYPAKRSATPLRWQTCNAETRRLAFSPPTDDAAASDMSRIDIAAVARQIADTWPTPTAPEETPCNR